MNRARPLKAHSADITLLAILGLAALSQLKPSLSNWLTIVACSVVGVFAAFSYWPQRPESKATDRPSEAPSLVSYERTNHSYSYSACRFEPWRASTLMTPTFSKRSGLSVGQFDWLAGRSHDKRHELVKPELVDLTDALPNNCTVRIGMVEIRLKDGETLVKMRSGRETASLKPETIFLEHPSDVRMIDEPQTGEIN